MDIGYCFILVHLVTCLHTNTAMVSSNPTRLSPADVVFLYNRLCNGEDVELLRAWLTCSPQEAVRLLFALKVKHFVVIGVAWCPLGYCVFF